MLKQQKQGNSAQSFFTLRDKQKPFELPQVTAQSWVIFDKQSQQILFCKNPRQYCEIASLTKIMTAYVAIDLIEQYSISLQQFIFIPSKATKIIGTSANLIETHKIKIIDCLYAIMLPSGNDASLVIANFLGNFIKKQNYQIKGVEEKQLSKKCQFKKNVKYFIKQMNKTSIKLLMKQTFFQNVHGLSHKPNLSTAEDIGILSIHYISKQLLRDICDTQQYSTFLIKENTQIPIIWKNTNRLLGTQGFFGIKTGITPTAGPCLSIGFQYQMKEYICIVINSKSENHRFKDAVILANFYLKYIDQKK